MMSPVLLHFLFHFIGFLLLLGGHQRTTLIFGILADVLSFRVFLLLRKRRVFMHRLQRLAFLLMQCLHFNLLVGGQSQRLGHAVAPFFIVPAVLFRLFRVERGRGGSGRICRPNETESTDAGAEG